MSLTVPVRTKATEPHALYKTVRGVRHPLLTRPRPDRAAVSSPDNSRSATGRRCLGSTLARHGTSVFLQMKDPDAIYPSLFSEDSTTSTKEKVKIIKKTKDVLRATRKGANHQRQDADAGAARNTETMTHASSARTPADTLHAEPSDVDSGHQDISAHMSTDQETHLDVPKQTVLPTPTPAPATSQQQPSRSLPSTITGKLYWMAGALFGTLEGCSKLLI